MKKKLIITGIIVVILLAGIATGLYFLAMFIKKKYAPEPGIPSVKINSIDPVNVNPNNPPYARAHLTVKNCKQCSFYLDGTIYDSNGQILGYIETEQDQKFTLVNNGEFSVDLVANPGMSANENNVTIQTEGFISDSSSGMHSPYVQYNGTLKFTTA